MSRRTPPIGDQRSTAGRTDNPACGQCAQVRKRIEKVFGWAKAAARFRKTPSP